MDENELKADLIKSLAAQMIADGVIDPTGMSAKEFRAAFVAEARAIVAEDGGFSVILDHQDSVLEQAQAFEASGKADFAITFYATWIEHRLNDMFIWKVKRLGKPQSEAVELIRLNSVKRKTGKVWTDTFGHELDTDIVATILDIADRRNAFVHYKWQAMGDEEMDDAKAEKAAVLAKTEPLVRQLIELRTDMVFGDSTGFLDKL
ncbi:hypothetical protein QWJ39_12325 [Arthrobacter sp. YD4]|uniref:hypothetical protein n=1 Tax=Arthrobacter sp. YD4 TaxID=3058043 RepID=UPI0025B59A38|nr:hypothetical protein [Arthrobacter sp. YD4]MDN3937093.1 hypothetical protein [Arthrobacter sp. YD4]